ncbi:N amino acid transport system protein like [Verticillium longisporum]|nr:N amino acid transport system protein like [Verticillium longisporum]
MSFACEGIIASNSNASNSSASGTSNIATISKTSSPSSSIATNASKFEASRSSYAVENPGEVFDQSEYRALGWIPAAVILLTLCFATGVLPIPATFSVLGYVPGLLVLLGFGALTTYYAYIMYVAGALFIVAWTLASGAGFVGLAQGFKALSSRNVCNTVWTLVAAVCTALLASIQTLGRLTIFTWIGFASLFTAVFIIVIGVTQVDRPAAAPQEGPFDIGVVTIGAPAVAPGLTAAVNIFAAFSSTPTFMPVIAEMKAPRAFKKSLFSSQIVLFICHVTMSLVVYLYCGKYVASPALGSAGGLLMKIAHGISIPGFIMTCTLRVHLAAKTSSAVSATPSICRTAVSLTGLGSTIGISSLAFICAGAVPFFSYLIGLHGALCLAPTCLVIPAWMGLYMDWELRRTSWKKRGVCHLHMFTVMVGLFMTVGGTTTTIQSIVDAYEAGSVGTPFSCT